MFRPFLMVVRPNDWTGRLAHLTIWIAGILTLLPVFLVRLPPRWVAWVGGHGFVIRIALLVLGLWLLGWMRAWLLARLPLAPYLVLRTLVFPDRGQRRRVNVSEVAEVFVEVRPPGLTQVFMVELRDGTNHEICPVDWPGAGRLYAALSRRVARQIRRQERRDRRAAKS